MDLVDSVTLLTIIFVLVDDWYQEYGNKLIPWTPGTNATFSHREVLTLLLAMDYFGYSGEKQFLGFIRVNYLGLAEKVKNSWLCLVISYKL